MAGKTERFQMRYSAFQRDDWKRQAQAEGCSVAELVCRRMDAPDADELAFVESLIRDGVNHRIDSAAVTLVDGVADPPRRESPCSHGRGEYQFCPVCDR
jgi:hypothetical protein